MPTQKIDLYKLFGSVANTLTQNQTSLNEADTYNHDHGDNMVQIFEVITQAMKEKKTASPAEQLAYASRLLSAKTQSGSAVLYAEGLKDASIQFKGQKQVTPNSAITLIQTLLGAQPQTSGQVTGTESGADLLGSLLDGLTGTNTGTQGTSSESPQIDLGDLLNAGMAFAQAKQAGGSTLDALLNAVVSSSKMGSSPYRSQSGTLVANTLIQAVRKLAARK